MKKQLGICHHPTDTRRLVCEYDGDRAVRLLIVQDGRITDQLRLPPARIDLSRRTGERGHSNIVLDGDVDEQVVRSWVSQYGMGRVIAGPNTVAPPASKTRSRQGNWDNLKIIKVHTPPSDKFYVLIEQSRDDEFEWEFLVRGEGMCDGEVHADCIVSLGRNASGSRWALKRDIAGHESEVEEHIIAAAATPSGTNAIAVVKALMDETGWPETIHEVNPSYEECII